MEGQKSFPRYFPLLLPLIALVLAGLLNFLLKPAQTWILNYYQTYEQDPILVALEIGYAVNRLLYASIFCIPLIYVVIYAISLLLTKLWALFLKWKENSDPNGAEGRSKQDVLEIRKIWVITHIFFVVCLIIAILCSRQVMYASYAGPAQNVRMARDAFQRDLANYQAGLLATYQGPLTSKGYIVPDKSLPDHGYYSFSTESSNQLGLRCPKDYFSGTQFLMQSYEAKYLPGTLYVVSIVGPDGKERLGPNARQKLGQDQWTYGDVVLEKSLNVPGYDALNEGQQRLFDLMNNGILLENLLQREQGVYSVRLGDPLTKDEFRKVSRLYRHTNADIMENFPLYSYYIEEDAHGKETLLHISGKDYGWRICRLYGPIFRQRAKEIADSLTDSGAQEKCQQITDYLLSHVSPVQKRAGPPENEWDLFPDTGFGALINGAGNSKGYALAFDAIARYAGLTVQLSEKEADDDGEKSKFWNTVRLENGHWMKIDVHTLALEKGSKMAKGAVPTRLAGNDEFGYVWVPARCEEAPASAGGELLYRIPDENSWIQFQRLESTGTGDFSTVVAAKKIRADIEAQAGVVYTDFPEYLAQDCHSHLLCAAFPDGKFLITWIYPGMDEGGYSLSIYGTSENIMELYTTVKQTFSTENPLIKILS